METRSTKAKRSVLCLQSLGLSKTLLWRSLPLPAGLSYFHCSGIDLASGRHLCATLDGFHFSMFFFFVWVVAAFVDRLAELRCQVEDVVLSPSLALLFVLFQLVRNFCSSRFYILFEWRRKRSTGAQKGGHQSSREKVPLPRSTFFHLELSLLGSYAVCQAFRTHLDSCTCSLEVLGCVWRCLDDVSG